MVLFKVKKIFVDRSQSDSKNPRLYETG